MASWNVMLFAGTATMVSAGCLLPARCLPPLPNDKLLHFLAYGALTLLAARIADNRQELTLWLLGLFCAGWAIEYLQNWIPDRKFCWRDLAANAAGILTAALCAPQLAMIRGS